MHELNVAHNSKKHLSTSVKKKKKGNKKLPSRFNLDNESSTYILYLSKKERAATKKKKKKHRMQKVKILNSSFEHRCLR